MKLYPTILTESLSELKKQIELIKNISNIEVVQIDVIDGFFADCLTPSALDLLEIDFGNLKIDFHLMTEEPLDFANEIFSVQKQLPVRAIIAQVERMSSQAEFLKLSRSKGLRVGLALDLLTPLSAIDKTSWSDLEILQLMAVEAGAQNQKFDDRVLDKIKEAKKLSRQRRWEIVIDGGIKLTNFKPILAAGADSLAVGSALWQSHNLDKTISSFLAYADKKQK